MSRIADLSWKSTVSYCMLKFFFHRNALIRKGYRVVENSDEFCTPLFHYVIATRNRNSRKIEITIRKTDLCTIKFISDSTEASA